MSSPLNFSTFTAAAAPRSLGATLELNRQDPAGSFYGFAWLSGASREEQIASIYLSSVVAGARAYLRKYADATVHGDRPSMFDAASMSDSAAQTAAAAGRLAAALTTPDAATSATVSFFPSDDFPVGCVVVGPLDFALDYSLTDRFACGLAEFVALADASLDYQAFACRGDDPADM